MMDCGATGTSACQLGTDATYNACTTNSGNSCDSSAGGNFAQNGLCASGATNSCNTAGFVCLSGVTYYADESALASCAEGSQCDETLTDGDFSAGVKRYDPDDNYCDNCASYVGEDGDCEQACGASSQCDELDPGGWWCTNNVITAECTGTNSCVYSASGGGVGTCEVTDSYDTNCGGSASCDELMPGACPDDATICSSSCAATDRDTSQAYCTDSTGCNAHEWNVGASQCCGDDGPTTEDWDRDNYAATTQCCLNGALLSNGVTSSNYYCYGANPQIHRCGGTDTTGTVDTEAAHCDLVGTMYCDLTGGIWTSSVPSGCSCTTGSQCSSSLCINGICRAAGSCSSYPGYGCSVDGNAWNLDAAGTCLSAGSCDYADPVMMDCGATGTSACQLGTDATYNACTTNSGNSCDSSAGGNFAQNGLCASGATNSCNTAGFVCLSGVTYYADESALASCAEGSQCDETLTDGDFSSGVKRYDPDDNYCDNCASYVGEDGDCEQACGASSQCDELDPGGWWCTNNVITAECTGTNSCVYSASGGGVGTCEVTDSYDTNCGGSAFCDEKLPSSTQTTCNGFGQTYFADTCSAACAAGDDTSICRSSAYGGTCTADAICNGRATLTCPSDATICTSACTDVDRDLSQAYCTDATGCNAHEWNVGASQCCGDDGPTTEDWDSDDYTGSTQCCVEGTLRDINWTLGNYLCAGDTPEIYRCGGADVTGDVENEASTCQFVEGWYCDINTNTWVSAVPLECSTMAINNIGETGFIESNNEYTSKQIIVVVTNISSSADICRYINYDDPYSLPPMSHPLWSIWERCFREKFWQLSDGEGNKTVYVQINYSSGRSQIYNDSIYLNRTGAGMDITPPSGSTVTLPPFSNVVNKVEASWSGASDYESEKILSIPLKYHYNLFRLDQPSLVPGYILYYPFNEGSTSTYAPDGSANGWDGTVNGPLWERDHGKNYGGYKFDGVDDYIELPSANVIGADTTYTLMAWIKIERSQYAHSIYGEFDSANSNTRNYLSVLSNNKVQVDNYPPAGTVLVSDAVLGNNTWHHIAYVRNGNTRQLYIDGQLDNSDTDGALDAYSGSAPNKAWVGARARDSDPGGVSNATSIKGNLDELLIYATALTSDQVRQNYLHGARILDSRLTSSESASSTGLFLSHGMNLSANVTAINSAGLTNTTSSDVLRIDLVRPLQPTVLSVKFRNKTNLRLQDVSEGKWIDAYEIYFNWTGTDALSGVYGYSFILDSSATSSPDEIVEGLVGGQGIVKEKTFIGMHSGQYYFKVRSKDNAGNWGNHSTVGIRIDNTPPTKPEVLSETFNAPTQTYTYKWSASSDPESLISIYRINITDLETGVTHSNTTNKTVRQYTYKVLADHKYGVIVGAQNNAGAWRWSNEKDIQADISPPEIDAKPSGIIVSAKPILAAWTNEIASCGYKEFGSSDDLTPFRYTNTTYHEDSLSLSSGSGYTYSVNCTDLAGNSAVEQVSFTIEEDRTVDGMDLEFLNVAYKGQIVKMAVTLESGSDALGEIPKSRIVLAISERAYPYSYVDMGEGRYNISFIAPDEAGTYMFRLRVDSAENLSDVKVDDIRLHVGYILEGALSTSSGTRMLYGIDDDGVKGMASDDDSFLIGSMDSADLNVSAGLDKPVFIFFTGEDDYLKKRDKMLKNGEFLRQPNPSFGYKALERHVIEFILKYDTIGITTDAPSAVYKGNYMFLMRNTEYGPDSQSILISPNIEENERKVFQYD
jgi:hypothetical protein